MLFRPLAAAPS
ncbi:hypothetical protein TGP89_289273, partial [Toxoplasma gondii p89]